MRDIEENVRFELDKLGKAVAEKQPDVVEVSGNDPCEYDGLPEFVRQVRRIANPREIHVSTYGGNLKNWGFFKSLMSAGMTAIRIPVYGPTAEVHDAVTCREGSFDEMIICLQNAKKSGCRVDVNSLILRENQDFLRGLFTAFSKLGFAKSFRLSFAAYPGDDGRFLKSVPDFGRLKKTLGGDLKYALSRGLRVDVSDIPYCLMGFDYPYAVGFSMGRKAYEHRRNDKQGVSIVDGEVVPDYLRMFKSEVCAACRYDGKCRGIFQRYFDKGFFKFESVK
jgi:MoaA/NifB/PqqE/SkfB family radical SAM enzyme